MGTGPVEASIPSQRSRAIVGTLLTAAAAGFLVAIAPDTAAIAGGAFATTNIDGFVALTALLTIDLAAGGRHTLRIFLGQALGVAVLTAGSLLAATLLSGVPAEAIVTLAVVPIVLGVRALLAKRGTQRGPRPPRPSGGAVVAVATIVVSGGADNIAVYTPLFHSLSPADTPTVAAVFLSLTALWCATAYATSRIPILARAVRRHGLRLVPYGYIAIGAVTIVHAIAG